MHPNTTMLFKKYAISYFKSNMRVLEVGPDEFPPTYKKMLNNESIQWDTLDIYSSHLLTYSNVKEYSFPIQDDTYDIVFSDQVIEHVRKPWIWIQELARITKIGGLVITINPTSWYFHEHPVDCWRIYPEGMKALYDEAKLTVLLSTFESLETPNYKRFMPGISLEAQRPKKRLAIKLLGKLGYPVERSYDAITIGRKDS